MDYFDYKNNCFKDAMLQFDTFFEF